ncbi:hypothetical protein SODALDRAFT_59022 [Sodiomyces alkalinus F11]|uniref:Uncharacterized protein n=1 Tax=Sodiomyces alkalinus (strain CBS 110278 / VKM F-3762 / F11) TaxID=1314773 RepID=A0A3N2PNR8_SODAK|nr:hypothetical protein SODALDRAFT_59022 [Sodiomyces alkalinus F11]ROT36167.1 hypothetical protein SODALDRAFT_59022 [Sodiomyces alkalinus F11]
MHHLHVHPVCVCQEGPSWGAFPSASGIGTWERDASFRIPCSVPRTHRGPSYLFWSVFPKRRLFFSFRLCKILHKYRLVHGKLEVFFPHVLFLPLAGFASHPLVIETGLSTLLSLQTVLTCSYSILRRAYLVWCREGGTETVNLRTVLSWCLEKEGETAMQ